VKRIGERSRVWRRVGPSARCKSDGACRLAPATDSHQRHVLTHGDGRQARDDGYAETGGDQAKLLQSSRAR
jgi:hypothetical protein